MKKTLLQVVQYVGTKINSDEISSIDETIEAQDITTLCLEVLQDILNRPSGAWEFLRDRPMTLETGTTTLSLAIPENVRKIQNVRYRIIEAGEQTGWRTLKYIYPDEYLCRLQSNKPTDPDTTTVLVNGIEVYPRTNRPPRYWTSFNESEIFLDSYDSEQNPTGLNPADSAIIATIYMDFSGSTVGTWVAPIPELLFDVWMHEAAAEASVAFRQADDQRAERIARRSYVQALKNEPVTHRDEGSREVNYGR